jgi:beta-lactamase superfamily II metal-dependent hydrolase
MPLGKTPGSVMFKFLNVGQGDGTLIIAPDNTTILYDLGATKNVDEPDRDVLDYLEEILKELQVLRSLDNPTIDYLFFTHPDKDHYNLFGDLRGKFTDSPLVVSKKIYVGARLRHYREKSVSGDICELIEEYNKQQTLAAYTAAKKTYDELPDDPPGPKQTAKLKMDAAKDAYDTAVATTVKATSPETLGSPGPGIPSLLAEMGFQFRNDPTSADEGTKQLFQVVYPGGGHSNQCVFTMYILSANHFNPEDAKIGVDAIITNGVSIIAMCEYQIVGGKTYRIILPGDATPAAQQGMVTKFDGDFLQSIAYKASHHGALNDTSDELLEKMHTRLLFVSALNHTFGHPVQAEIERISNHRCTSLVAGLPAHWYVGGVFKNKRKMIYLEYRIDTAIFGNLGYRAKEVASEESESEVEGPLRKRRKKSDKDTLDLVRGYNPDHASDEAYNAVQALTLKQKDYIYFVYRYTMEWYLGGQMRVSALVPRFKDSPTGNQIWQTGLLGPIDILDCRP